MKLTRQNKSVAKEISRWDLDGKITDAIDFLTGELLAIPEPYRATASLEISSYLQYGDPTTEIMISYSMPETDDELAARQAAADARAKQDEERQRAEYARLKAMFEAASD